jgi:hypothetical protein
MFWHFDGDCYGKPNWAADYLRESQYSVFEVFYEALDRSGATTLDELAAIIKGLEDSGCATEGGGDSGTKDDSKDTTTDTTTTTTDPTSCQAEYDELQETYALGLLIEATGVTISCGDDGCLGDGSNGDGDGSSGNLAGDPIEIVGGIDEGGITSGPNFKPGRRTWIDILPE